MFETQLLSIIPLIVTYMHKRYANALDLMNMNNHVHRAPFSDIHVERKKEVAKSKERRKEIHVQVYLISTCAFVSL